MSDHHPASADTHQPSSYQLIPTAVTLMCRLSGAWNADIAEQYLLAVLDEAHRFQSEPWQMLVDLRNWQLMTPQAVEAFARFNRSIKATGLTQAIYLVRSANLGIARYVARSAFDDYDFRRVFTTSVDEALTLLAARDSGELHATFEQLSRTGLTSEPARSARARPSR